MPGKQPSASVGLGHVAPARASPSYAGQPAATGPSGTVVTRERADAQLADELRPGRDHDEVGVSLVLRAAARSWSARGRRSR